MVFATKRTWFAYLLWLIGGYFGLHLLYVGRDRQAFVYCITFGGFFGCGWLRDVLWIPTYVAEANGDPECRLRIADYIAKHSKPPFSIFRYLIQVVVAYLLGLLVYWSVPQEEVYSCDLTWLWYLIPVAVSIGVHTVGNIGYETGGLKAPIVSSAIGALLANFLYESKPSDRLFWSCFAASSAFTFRSKRWRTVDDILGARSGFFRRLLVISAIATAILVLVCSGLYFNAEMNTQTGARVKFRIVAADFLRSPEWQQLRTAARDTYNFYKAHGWRKILDVIIEQLDPDGEQRAQKVLGVKSNASKQDIVARWRVLSKEWHPDRHRDLAKKAEAHKKFMDYQAAYQVLIKTRGKFKAAPQPEMPSIKLDL